MKQEGQVVIILLLLMVLALAIALSVVGRSVSEVSTATKSEDSSRAFSAAQAGAEQALKVSLSSSGNVGTAMIPFTNQSQVKANWTSKLPDVNKAIEYVPFGRGSFAQFWLANTGDLTVHYNQGKFNIYFGDPKPNSDPAYYITHPGDKPAIEVNIIYKDVTSGYVSNRQLVDSDSSRALSNGWPASQLICPASIYTNDYPDLRTFYCKATVNVYPSNPPVGAYPVMVRVRILYSSIDHPVALGPEPVASCASANDSCAIPPQLTIFRSTGTAGSAQRRIQIFQQDFVMPQMFDFALFSAGSLSK